MEGLCVFSLLVNAAGIVIGFCAANSPDWLRKTAARLEGRASAIEAFRKVQAKVEERANMRLKKDANKDANEVAKEALAGGINDQV